MGGMAAVLDNLDAAATGQIFQLSSQATSFINWVNAQGDSAWEQGWDPAGNPVFTTLPMPGQEGFLLQTVPVPDQQVVAGEIPPQGFSWNGQSYNIVGTITATLSYTNFPLWTVEVPLGLLEAYPIAQLAGLAWSSLFVPIVTAFKKGVQASLRGATGVTTTEEAGDVAGDAATEAVVDGEIVGDATLDLVTGGVALVGLVILVAIPFLLFHHKVTINHNFKIYNLTDQDLFFSVKVDGGSMTLGPADPGPQPWPYQVPATSTSAPPGIAEVQVAHEADLAMVSDSHGDLVTKIALGFRAAGSGADPATLGTLRFEVTKNSKTLQLNDTALQQTYQGAEDQLQLAPMLNGQLFELTATYDPAGDPGPQETGKSTYATHSLVVLFNL
jgi:hypothetical protein